MSGGWLDEEQQRAWVSLRAVGTLLDTALDRQLQRDSGISHATYVILSVLSEMPDRTLPMTQLARLANSSQSRASHAVARLEELGWVTRVRAEDNKRVVNATLTDAGYDVVVCAAPGHVAKVKELVFDRLDREQVQALATVNLTVLRAIQADGIPVLTPFEDLTAGCAADPPG